MPVVLFRCCKYSLVDMYKLMSCTRGPSSMSTALGGRRGIPHPYPRKRQVAQRKSFILKGRPSFYREILYSKVESLL